MSRIRAASLKPGEILTLNLKIRSLSFERNLERKKRSHLFKSAFNKLVDRLETFLPLSRFARARCELAAVLPKAASPVLQVGILQTPSGKTVLGVSFGGVSARMTTRGNAVQV